MRYVCSEIKQARLAHRLAPRLRAEPTGCGSQCSVMWGAGVSCSVCPALCDPWTVAHQVPLSLGFPRQGHPSPGEATQSALSISSQPGSVEQRAGC